MAGNKFLVEDSSTLLKNKLDKLSRDLQSSLTASKFQTQEAFLLEAIKVLNSFYRTLRSPQLQSPTVRVDQAPNVEDYQALWQQLIDDLTIVFTEIENIEAFTVANFNFATTEANRLTARLKAVSSKLGDYILYSLTPTKDAFFFKDSFNDLSKVAVGSSLLNATECKVNQTEGIVTLPINVEESSILRVTETPIIDPASNGVMGNNQQLNAAYNGDITTILDSNPDTWFEYENVVVGSRDTKEPLTLGVVVNLGSEKVINHIRVNPNNFGTKTTVQIDAIDTSIDGDLYTSVKDDIPIANFIIEDEANIFTLAPSTSKYAGQGLYTFTPRKVKYVRFIFRQTEPYVINTPSGERLRYAIGIRDVEIRAYSHNDTGELVSSLYESQNEIRKVSLQANQNPSELSELVAIKYLVSPDDGGSWHEIQPKELEGVSQMVSTPEILEFNGPSANTIVTSRPVRSLRLKMRMTRNDGAFADGSSTLKKSIDTRTETHAVPAASPFTLVLERPPVDGTVSVIDPLFGSRGLPEFPYYLGHAIDGLNQRTYRLPFKNFPRPVKKVLSGGTWHTEPVSGYEWMHAEVGGKEWYHATQPLSAYGASDEVYTFDHDAGVFKVGDGTNGKAPGSNEPIALWFDAERLFPSEAEDAHVAKLEFPTSNSKADMHIKRYDKIELVTEVFRRRATVLRLKNKNITEIISIEPDTLFQSGDRKTFINGKDELTATGYWSVDMDEGIVYTRDPTPSISDISITYKYQPIYELETLDWEWATANLLRDAVAIKETAWKTLTVTDEEVTLEEGATVIDVEHLALVRGTILFDVVSGVSAVPTSLHPFVKEVPYRDGRTELGEGAIQTIQQLGPHTGSGVESWSLDEKIVTSTNYAVSFSKTDIFITNKGSLPVGGDNDGTYWVNRAASPPVVYLKWDTAVADPGTITYYYDNPNSLDNGLFSINYLYGTIHTQRHTSSTWTLYASYEYTDFRAEYRIARLLDREHYDVDIANQSVRIRDGEVLSSLLAPRSSLTAFQPFYLVNYDYVVETREEIAELRDYFTPVIKDYALKILTKGKIF